MDQSLYSTQKIAFTERYLNLKELDFKQQTLILTVTFYASEINVVTSINPDLMQTFAVFKNTIFY